jgi:anti-anti-sigma factor
MAPMQYMNRSIENGVETFYLCYGEGLYSFDTADLVREISKSMKDGFQITLDLTDIKYMDSMGIAVILMLRRKASLNKAKLSFVNVRPTVMEAMRNIGLEKLFE